MYARHSCLASSSNPGDPNWAGSSSEGADPKYTISFLMGMFFTFLSLPWKITIFCVRDDVSTLDADTGDLRRHVNENFEPRARQRMTHPGTEFHSVIGKHLAVAKNSFSWNHIIPCRHRVSADRSTHLPQTAQTTRLATTLAR